MFDRQSYEIGTDRPDNLSDPQRVYQFTMPRKPVYPGSSSPLYKDTAGEPQVVELHKFSDFDGSSQPISASSTTQLKGEPHHDQDTGEWSPFVLRLWVLLTNLAILLLIVISLEVIAFVSRKQNGLAAPSEKMSYLWTYGPTGILIPFVVFWTQVEYRAKQLMPWKALRQHPAQPDRTINMNYFAPWMPVALWTSIKNRDFLVSLAILGRVFFQITVIVSTGLLALEPRNISLAADLVLVDQFNFSSSRAEEMDLGNSRPIQSFWAVQSYNVLYPVGTTSRYAVQTFYLNDKDTPASVTASVQVFAADIVNCESFEWTLLSPSGRDNGTLRLELRSASYSIQEWYIDWEPSGPTAPSNSTTTPFWAGRFGTSYSNNSVASLHPDPEYAVVALAQVGTGEIHPPNPSNLDVSGIICRTKYSLTKRAVTNSTCTAQPLQVSEEVDEQIPLEISSVDITGSYMVPGPGPGSAGQDITFNNPNPYASSFSGWFTLLNITHPQKDVSDFKNLTLLETASRDVFQSLLAQVGKDLFTSPTNGTAATGTKVMVQNRLLVQELSLRMMEASLLLVAFCIVGLLFLCRGSAVAPGNPASLIACAGILAKSPDVARVLTSTSTLTEQQFNQLLSKYIFSSPFPGQPDYLAIHPSVEISTQDYIEDPTDEHDGVQDEWWHPLGSKRFYHITITLIQVAVIILLETLYQISQRYDGITAIPQGSYTHYAWRFIPAIIMTGLGLSFAVMDDSIRVLHPYQRLVAEKATFKDLYFDSLATPSLLTAFRGIMQGFWSLGFFAIITTLAPTLTMIISGLYSPHLVLESQESLVLEPQGWFNIVERNKLLSYWNSNSSSKEALDVGPLMNAIHFYNLSFPAGTYDDLAFPPLDMPRGESVSTNLSAISGLVPAVRAQFNCSLLEAQSYHLSDSGGSYFELTVELAPSSLGCPSTEPNTNVSLGIIPDGAYFGFQKPWMYAGDAIDIGCGQRGTHVLSAVGHLEGAEMQDLSLIYCRPFLEALLVDVQYTFPGFDIDATKPPQPVENSSVFLSNVHSATAPPAPNYGITGGGKDDEYLDDFFNMLVHGVQGTPIKEITGPDNVPRLMEKMSHIYRQQIAQMMNLHYRSPLNGNVTIPPAAPNLLDPIDATGTSSVLRLKQDLVSTRLLEVVLAIMLLCSLTAFPLIKRGKILPRDPRTISSKLSLLAGSHLVSRISDNSSASANQRFRRNETFNEERFKLGWWATGEGRVYRIDTTSATKGENHQHDPLLVERNEE